MALTEVYWDRQIPLPKLAPIQAKVTVALVSLLCFINSYDGEFVFDDSEAIVNNKVISLFSQVRYLNITVCKYCCPPYTTFFICCIISNALHMLVGLASV